MDISFPLSKIPLSYFTTSTNFSQVAWMASRVVLEGLIFHLPTNNAQWGICAAGHVMQLQLTACPVP